MVGRRGVGGFCLAPISAWRPRPALRRSQRLRRLEDLLNQRRVEIFSQRPELAVRDVHDIAVRVAIRLARFRDGIALALNDDDIAVAEDSVGSIRIGPGEFLKRGARSSLLTACLPR
jgi:hypothetical protein